MCNLNAGLSIIIHKCKVICLHFLHTSAVFFPRMRQVRMLGVFCVFCVLVCVHAGDRVLAVSVKDLSVLPSVGVITVREGTSVVIKCNVSELHEHVEWYNSKGHVLNGEDSGESFNTLIFCSVQRSEIMSKIRTEQLNLSDTM